MKEILQNIIPEITKIRQLIHANPELAHEENDTSSLIISALQKYGYQDVTRIAYPGVTTVLDSGIPGKTVALRADIDALPIQEQNDLFFQSKNPGKMHACGHDGHTATLLAVAATLTQCKHLLKGKIKFIFQPAEETGTGAMAMINNGILENPKVDAIFSYHNTPRSELGIFKAKAGCMMAGQDTFKITIKGRGGHAAHPNLTIDPIYIGATIIQTIQSVVSRYALPTEAVVVSVTQFHAGTTHNVIPAEATLSGTIRTVTLETQAAVKQRISEIVSNIASAFGASATVDYQYHFPPTINSPDETNLAINTAKQVLGEKNIEPIDVPSMASEDFSYYLERVPGCFFFMGIGLDAGAIHSANYRFNDAVIPIAAELLCNIAINYLNNERVS